MSFSPTERIVASEVHMNSSETTFDDLLDVHLSLLVMSDLLVLATRALEEDNRALARTLVKMAGRAATSTERVAPTQPRASRTRRRRPTACSRRRAI
jgi:hypothetical protein